MVVRRGVEAESLMRTSPGRAQRARTGAPRRGNEKVPKRKSWEFRCVRNFVGRARGENNDNENNDNEAKKCYREALYLDPTYSSAQQSLTALETREARAADRGVAGARRRGAAR